MKIVLPCINRIPEPLCTTTHGNPVSRKFCCCLLPTQWSKLPKMSVPGFCTSVMSKSTNSDGTCAFISLPKRLESKDHSVWGLSLGHRRKMTLQSVLVTATSDRSSLLTKRLYKFIFFRNIFVECSSNFCEQVCHRTLYPDYLILRSSQSPKG